VPVTETHERQHDKIKVKTAFRQPIMGGTHAFAGLDLANDASVSQTRQPSADRGPRSPKGGAYFFKTPCTHIKLSDDKKRPGIVKDGKCPLHRAVSDQGAAWHWFLNRPRSNN
jgi:hypothetical protein